MPPLRRPSTRPGSQSSAVNNITIGAKVAVTFVGAGTGLALTTGTGTASKTGCTSGNLIFGYIVARGVADDWGIEGSSSNIETLGGSPNNFDYSVAHTGTTGLHCTVFTGAAMRMGPVALIRP